MSLGLKLNSHLVLCVICDFHSSHGIHHLEEFEKLFLVSSCYSFRNIAFCRHILKCLSKCSPKLLTVTDKSIANIDWNSIWRWELSQRRRKTSLSCCTAQYSQHVPLQMQLFACITVSTSHSNHKKSSPATLCVIIHLKTVAADVFATLEVVVVAVFIFIYFSLIINHR